MKKLFISIPMRNRTDEAIMASMSKMKDIAETITGEQLQAISKNIVEVPEGHLPSVYSLGKSIMEMSEADYYIGVAEPYNYSGCRIENDVVKEYGIPAFFISIKGIDCFADVCENLIK